MSQSPDHSRLAIVTTAQAAILHDVEPATIRAWQLRGLLQPCIKVGGINLYRVEDVDRAEMLARQRDTSGRSKKRLN